MAEKKKKQFVIDNPKLIAEWNWEKNDSLEITPESLVVGSTQKVKN